MRLYLDGEWFDPVSAESMYEMGFESLVMQHASDLFPSYMAYRFDPKLSSPPLGNVQPDMALIDRNYRHWYIVEVELATHSWAGHVGPQLEKIVNARPGREDADWLADRHAEIERERLARMMDDVPHRTMLLVNVPNPRWQPHLQRMPDVQQAVIETYRSRFNRTLLRVNGAQPEVAGNILCQLERGTGWLASALQVLMPAVIPVDVEALDIDLDGRVSTWRLKWLGRDRFLFPRGSIDLPTTQSWVTLGADNVYRIGAQ